MANWTHKQKSDNQFMSSFSNEVKKYIGIKDGFPSSDPARWLLDSYQLTKMDWPNTYGDYSFIVVSACKALEYWIFEVAKDLGIEINTNKAGQVRDQIEKEINKALDGIEDKTKQSIEIDVAQLRNIWQEYRNDIVHCKKKIENVEQAKNKVVVIYDRINTVTEKLLNANLIKLP